MAAIDTSLIARSQVEFLTKRSGNWAHKNPGVILVFCIIGAIAILLSGLFIQKKLVARKNAAAH
ncbi:hypothetical protein K432DRAFT_293200 [Lepidopterella palustris CBS 459.81]|uniref:Uncharacterized protein n=1 Tax=Lepidopterella palustris CBS 459.81 TaxID=1314670 RepID=A0A8E2EER8_9PEZI|nr:hypothetical protein K432DRAFT_293200 [Lepidopterella palustris CBS 459.81]